MIRPGEPARFARPADSRRFDLYCFAKGRADDLRATPLAGVGGILQIGRRLGRRDAVEHQPSGADRARHDQGRQLRRCNPLLAAPKPSTQTLTNQFLVSFGRESRFFCAVHTLHRGMGYFRADGTPRGRGGSVGDELGTRRNSRDWPRGVRHRLPAPRGLGAELQAGLARLD